MAGFNGYESVVYDTMMDSPGTWSESLEWRGLRSEVEAEARAEIVMLGCANVGKSTLYSSLRGFAPAANEAAQREEPLPAAEVAPPVADTLSEFEGSGWSVEEPLGLFTLVDLPPAVADDPLLWGRLENASLLIYLVDAGSLRMVDPVSATHTDLRWVARLQATGRPLLLALSKADLCGSRLPDVLAVLEQQFGLPVVAVSAYGSPELPYRFLLRVMELCPTLAVPLGREITLFRQTVAQRMILHTAFRCGMVSLQPIPLLDLPLQISAMVGLVARLGTMYGHPPTSDDCKELMAAGIGSTLLRIGIQQASKAVPVVGWVVSGILGGFSAWVMGQSALAYFDGRATPQRLGQWLRLAGTETLNRCLWLRSCKETRTRLAEKGSSLWRRFTGRPESGIREGCSLRGLRRADKRLRMKPDGLMGRRRWRRRRPDVIIIESLRR